MITLILISLLNLKYSQNYIKLKIQLRRISYNHHNIIDTIN